MNKSPFSPFGKGGWGDFGFNPSKVLVPLYQNGLGS